jgi:hypothetical protein
MALEAKSMAVEKNLLLVGGLRHLLHARDVHPTKIRSIVEHDLTTTAFCGESLGTLVGGGHACGRRSVCIYI